MTQNCFGYNPLKSVPHPLYSTEISDFYLFGKIKSALIGGTSPNGIDLLDGATEILNGISDAELQRIFRSWIEHTERMINAEGDCSTE
jgi:hypothetical protein